MSEMCNAPVQNGTKRRASCGAKSATTFKDDIDGTVVHACKRHAVAYRRNPKTWREVIHG
jgi:hypothetical protein